MRPFSVYPKWNILDIDESLFEYIYSVEAYN